VEFGTEKYTTGLLSHAKIGSDQQMGWVQEPEISKFGQNWGILAVF